MVSSIENRPVGRLQKGVVRLLEYMAAIILAGIMLLIIVDVVARYLFHKPIAASFEITEMAMQVMIYLCIAVAMASNDHIRVTLIDPVLARAPRLARWIERLSAALVAAALFGTGFAVVGLAQGKAVDVTAVLGLPIAPVAWTIAVALMLSAALAIYAVAVGTTHRDEHND
jgi:TRAP-type C4-dicarboxylate transport system permease small subunit